MLTILLFYGSHYSGFMQTVAKSVLTTRLDETRQFCRVGGVNWA